MSKTYNVETVPFDSKIKVEIPGSFLTRIHQLAMAYGQMRPNEELVAAMEKLKGKEQASNEFEYNMHTLTILIFEIENAAKEQNLIKMKTIEIPDKGEPTVPLDEN